MSKTQSRGKPLTEGERLLFLGAIQDRKDVLFGSYSQSITRERKVEAWKAVRNECIEGHGFDPCPPSKDHSYLRDSLWPNYKNYTMSKRADKEKTGNSGGREKLYTAVDLKVLEILGKDSAVMVGLPVDESYQKEANREENPYSPEMDEQSDSENFGSDMFRIRNRAAKGLVNPLLPQSCKQERPASTNPPQLIKSTPQSRPPSKSPISLTDSIVERKSRKLDLEIEHLQLLNENLRLKNKKLKLELETFESTSNPSSSNRMTRTPLSRSSANSGDLHGDLTSRSYFDLAGNINGGAGNLDVHDLNDADLGDVILDALSGINN